MEREPGRRALVSFAAITLLLAAALLGPSAAAHEIRPAIIDLDLSEPGRYRLSMRLNLEAVLAEIGPEHKDTSDSPDAAKYDALRELVPEQLALRFADFEPRFLGRLQLSADGSGLSPQVTGLDIPPVGDTDLARDSVLTLAGELPPGISGLTWGWDPVLGPNVLRVTNPDGSEGYTAYLLTGQTSELIPVTGAPEQSGWAIFADYLIIGYEHILPKGLDHILFVVGLFLLNARLRSLLWQVTSFTVAHTVTLALGIYGIVNVPPAIVEPLIAASIVYVCVENVLSDKLFYWRPVVVFMFGLLHGLGFAGVLLDIGLVPAHFLTGLVAFNVGVELGQLTVIGICFLAVGAWFRKKSWYRARITVPASMVIAAIGAYWFVDRAFLGA